MKINNFESFKVEIVERIREWLPAQLRDAEICLHTIRKNNGIKLTALVIRRLECNNAPNIYLEQFYELYKEGVDMNSILWNIAQLRMKNELDTDIDVSFLMDFDCCKKRIMPRLIGTENNEGLLRERTHVHIEDLAVTFDINLGDTKAGNASIPVNNGLSEIWGVTPQDLYKTAIKNLEDANIGVFRSMYDILLDMLPEDSDLLTPTEEMKHMDNMMYVLTSESMTFGAAVILDRKLMRRILNRIGGENGLIVIPSSIHEVILIPDHENKMKKGDLEDMVREVNETQVPQDELLSNCVYRYTLQDGLVRM